MAGTKKQRLAVIVGANITARRKLLGWNQAAFAERLGMGADSLSRIERGLVAPRFQRLEEIAEILECSVAELFMTPRRSGEVPDQLLVPEAGGTADRHQE